MELGVSFSTALVERYRTPWGEHWVRYGERSEHCADRVKRVHGDGWRYGHYLGVYISLFD